MAWHLGANHAGGYSYRLCKMPEGGIGDLTEECFQQNPLDFVGDIQWIEYQKDKNTGFRTELEALQTTEGTHPAGSMWRANQILPKKEEGGSSEYGSGTIIDSVSVPSDLEPGQYVVSFRWVTLKLPILMWSTFIPCFRWDSKCSPQVWGSCATVQIVSSNVK